MASLDNLRSWSRRQGTPVTIAMMASFIVFALIFWFSGMRGFETFALARDSLTRPWSLVTFPWVGVAISDPFSIIFFLFLIYWVFWMGGSLERDLGSVVTAILWAASILGTGLVLLLGVMLLGSPVATAGPFLPIAALTVLWCGRNPANRINLWGVIPLTSKWFAALIGVMIFLTIGLGNPILGVIALIPSLAAWFYGIGSLPQIRVAKKEARTARGVVVLDQRYFDEVKRRETERSERERLRKLFEGDSSPNDER